ncbi:MAG: hypothetical protein HFI08_01595, partial [Bacilli bacterium]|nr:hypothetical protein [Bacilli bacterium]
EIGEFTFVFKDKAVNFGRATASVIWIDKKAPEATLNYSTLDLTNEDVTVTVEFDKENVRITNNGGSNTYTFTENGEFTFEFVDEFGNTGIVKAVVQNIDKKVPVATLIYSRTELTNQDVEVIVIFDKENVRITNNDGLNIYTFIENGEFTFEYVDKAGNTGFIKAVVDYIDKKTPVATIVYDKTTLTSDDVIASISFDEENVTILNNEGKNTYTFTENGEFVFEFRDQAGNVGSAKAVVNWIDKKAPVASITYSKNTMTNQDVIATITFDKENVTITNNGGNNTYTFKENGEFTFEYVDEVGNKGTAVARVDWINKNGPDVTITYSKDTVTNQDVMATITFDEENVTITNNEGKNTYTFTENGEFIFEFIDKAGNVGSAKASVNWIDKKTPVATITYDKTTLINQDVTASVAFDEEHVTITNNGGLNTYTFTENGEFVFEFVDEAGNVGSAKASVTWIDKTLPIVKIQYNITSKTNQNVTATLLSDKDVVVLNNISNVYTFTENGEFTFEFVDKAGNKGSITAIVTWIDKKAPVATIVYDKNILTNQNVTATITFDKLNVTVSNNNGNNTYTFTENGEFIFEFVDEVGNKGSAKANVTWIDKKTPVATITYDKTTLINQDVTASITFDKEHVTIMNNGGSDTYTFTENGEFVFEYVDEAGNKGNAKASVNWIDKKVPVATINFDRIALTNQDVTASITFDKEHVTILNNEGKNTYTFTENGEFVFEYRDQAGNAGTMKVTVCWIDKKAPNATITYSKEILTNQDVIATIHFDKVNVTILNNNGNDTHIFTENGEFIFEFVDEAGNKGTAVACVDWINKNGPEATLTYDKTTLTNQNVIATVTFDRDNVTITNNSGLNTYTFTENGEFTFEFVDEAGNKGIVKANVNWIDKTSPVATITYDKTTLINQDVTASITFDKEHVTITNNNGNNTYTFTENGEFIFEFVDEAGNKGSAKASVNWIDKTSPVATIIYNKNTLTNQEVIATITFDKEHVTILNNDGKNTYTFTENGEFIFEFVDEAGNKGTAKASVNWIDKILPVATIHYDKTFITNQSVVASITFDKANVTITNNGGSDTYTFTENGKFIFEFVDEAGNKGSAEANVTWINKNLPNAIITYDKNTLTNQNVTATITFDRDNVTITNNNGLNTYTFTENGEFTFEFVDEAGNNGGALAVVDWIDREAPVATIVYDKNSLTNENVYATIMFNKENVTITNNGGSDTYTFTENGEFVFEYVDEAGNVGSTKASVTWIDRVKPIPIITFDYDTLTNHDVTATITFNKNNVTIINNNGSNTYTFTENGEFTFEYVDEAGNKNETVVKVDWIDKVAPNVMINYSTIVNTKYPVIATIISDKEISITNNQGQKSYTFTENGEFTFEFVDKAGNTGSIKAKVSWILKDNENNQNPNFDSNQSTNTYPSDVTKPNQNVIITSYSVAGIKISFNTANLSEIVSFDKHDLSLTDALANRFASVSEYFNLFVKTKTEDMNYLESTPIKMTIHLDPNKTFLGIYKVDGEVVEKLNHTLLSKSEIELKTAGLGTYIISYEENKKDELISNETDSKVTEEKKSILNWILSVITLVLGSSGVIVYKKKINKEVKN